MRTKALLLTAAAVVAGTVAASAQTVYSVNAVGYVNTTCPVGFSIIANPLNAANNKLSALIPNPPDLTTIYEWVDNTFLIATFYADTPTSGSWDNDLDLAPGTGAWIFNPGTSPLGLTFVGEVLQGKQDVAIGNGLSLVASKVPQAGDIDTALGYVPADLDAVYFWRDNTFYICTYYGTPGQPDAGWDNPPTAGVGEGFWVLSSGAKTWSRTFNINN